nr:hypothetical protein [Lysinibacillus timonensis]
MICSSESKEGYDSYQNMKETKELAEELESKYKRDYKNFEKGRDETNNTFEITVV